jgi:hypothetical protein
MGNQPLNQAADPNPPAGVADPQVAVPPAAEGAPTEEQQDYETLYRQAMEDNQSLLDAYSQTQARLEQTSMQAQAVAAQTSIQQMQQQEQAFLASLRDLPDEDREARIRQFYGHQTGQILQLAQAFVQRQAIQGYLGNVIQRYGLSEQEARRVASVHPSQIEAEAQRIVEDRQRFSELQQQLQKLTASQVAQQMQQSGAYAPGAGNVPPQAAPGGQQVQPGSRQHLLSLLTRQQ